MKDVHWVVVADWCIDYESGNSIVKVCHSEDEACEAMKKRVDSDDRILAEQYGYKVFEDSPMCFDSGRDGEYATDHITVSVVKVGGEE